MIRRGFWIAVGVAGGIMGYRRVAALGRRVGGARNRQVTREAVRFTRDVRDGMELYIARHPRPAGSTLSTHTDHDDDEGDGR